MASRLPPNVTLYRFGREQQPVVQIDEFSGMAEELLRRGRSAEYQAAGASYPGIRSWCEPDYLDRNRELMFAALQQVFKFRKGVSLDVSTFSLVTLAPEDLSPLQRIPHYDHASGEIVAVMHYLLGPETGGTAFYRHRRTGFETITEDRADAYNAGLAADEREFGMPPAEYYHGDGDRFEQIGVLVRLFGRHEDQLVGGRRRDVHAGAYIGHEDDGRESGSLGVDGHHEAREADQLTVPVGTDARGHRLSRSE